MRSTDKEKASQTPELTGVGPAGWDSGTPFLSASHRLPPSCPARAPSLEDTSGPRAPSRPTRHPPLTPACWVRTGEADQGGSDAASGQEGRAFTLASRSHPLLGRAWVGVAYSGAPGASGVQKEVRPAGLCLTSPCVPMSTRVPAQPGLWTAPEKLEAWSLGDLWPSETQRGSPLPGQRRAHFQQTPFPRGHSVGMSPAGRGPTWREP